MAKDDTTFADILDEDDETVVETPTAEAVAAPDSAEPTEPVETPPPVVAEAEPEAPAPITREDGATWSEKAQRWYKDGKIVAGEAPAKVEQVESSPTPPPVVAEAPKAPEAPAAPVVEPFTFRAEGRRVPIEGATLAPDGSLLIPAAQVANVRGMFAAAVAHRRSGDVAKQHEERVRQAEAAGAAKGDKYNKASVLLWSRLESMLQDNPTELEMLRREVALTLREADLSAPRTQAQPEQEVDLEPAARATLSDYLTELFEDLPGAKLLSNEDKQVIGKAFQRRLNAYFEEIEGEPALDTHKVREEFEYELSMYTRAHQARESAARDAEKAKAAAAFNAAQKPGVAVPPTLPRPKPALAAVPNGAPAKKDWSQRVNDIWNDEDED